MNNEDVRELIEGIRGGVPGVCSFCQKEKLPHELEPEEAGDWACRECLARWRAEELAEKGLSR